jgi:L-malate glycosyltransferase
MRSVNGKKNPSCDTTSGRTIKHMRLLVVSHSYILANTRGKLRHLGKLAEVTVLVPKYWPFDIFAATMEQETITSFQIESDSVRLAGRNTRYFFSLSYLRHVLKQIKPEVVYVEEEPISLALAQFSLLKKLYPYRLCYFTWENIGWQPRLTKSIGQFNFYAADGAIAGNKEAVAVLRSKGFRGPVAVIPQMGVDLELFSPPTQQVADAPFIICFAGRFVEEKGLRVLFKAVAHMSGNWELHMIGRGPMRPELEHMASLDGWVERLRWIDFMPREALPDYFRRIHTLVLPSHTTPHWKEQFGRVLIEAMACGVPVIGSSSGAIPEVIGEAGLIFPENDDMALYRAVQSMMNDELLRHNLAGHALKRVQQHYTDQVVAQATYEFLRTACKE